MKDMSRNNGTKEMEMEVKEGRIRKTTYEKPSLMEYGPIETLTQGNGSVPNESFGGGLSTNRRRS